VLIITMVQCDNNNNKNVIYKSAMTDELLVMPLCTVTVLLLIHSSTLINNSPLNSIAFNAT